MRKSPHSFENPTVFPNINHKYPLVDYDSSSNTCSQSIKGTISLLCCMFVSWDPVAHTLICSLMQVCGTNGCLHGVKWNARLLELSTLPAPDHKATLEHASLNPYAGIITTDETCHVQQLLLRNQITFASLAFRGRRYEIINMQQQRNDETNQLCEQGFKANSVIFAQNLSFVGPHLLSRVMRCVIL